jgi:hypothetical protein
MEYAMRVKTVKLARAYRRKVQKKQKRNGHETV